MRQRRWLLGAGAGVVLIGVVLTVTVGRYFASTTTAAPGAAATIGPSAAPPVLPRPGVYVYATTGSDRVDALGGDRHEYPATTTITVTPAGCGVLQRWDVLEERWETWQRCSALAGVLEPARTNYDEFFDNGVREEHSCAGDPRPLHATAGSTWRTVCTDEDGTAETHRGSVVGAEPRQVEGATVDTAHVTVVVTDDDNRNLQTIDTWYLAGTDLVVAQTSTDHAVNSSPIGDVDYDEEYTIELTSLTPVTTG